MRATHVIVPFLFILITAAPQASGRDWGTPAHPARSRAAVPQWKNDWSRGAVFYEVFVRSFKDSNGDGIGDLRGLTSKLDYLNDGNPSTTSDLGVDALWLMPVFASPSYHGYDVTDYETINPEYGTNDDFVTLCAEAHKRGIRIILDYVINHSSSEHPWFIDSASGPVASRRNWYVWSPTDPGWKQPWGGSTPTWHKRNGTWYYGLFWSGMPDLNYRSVPVRQYVKKTALLWLSRGADGFRLDAARYITENGAGQLQADTAETHTFWKEFSLHLRRTKPAATIVGENWADTSVIATYYGSPALVTGGDELCMNFNFPLAERILQGIRLSNATGIAGKISEVLTAYPAGATDAPFLTNHDQVRLATQLSNDPGRLRNATALLLTLPGSPFLYYGEEVGIQNGTASGDEPKRTPMPWDSTAGGGFTKGTPWYPFSPGRETANVAKQAGDKNSLLWRYRNLIAARKKSTALVKGGIQLLTRTTGTDPVLAFIRADGTERVLVAHNLSDVFTVAGPYDCAATSAERIFADPSTGNPSGAPGSWRIMLPPRASGIWRLK